jgi:hypothetical protein
MVIRWSRSLQCLMSKIFETTYHHKLPFNSKDMKQKYDLLRSDTIILWTSHYEYIYVCDELFEKYNKGPFYAY